MTDTLDETAQQIADAGRDALLARLRPAFERAAAAHADILEIPPDRLDQMIREAAERADGLQWRRALAGVAVDQLGIELSEALRHPAVARAQELLGAPVYEDAFGDVSPAVRADLSGTSSGTAVSPSRSPASPYTDSDPVPSPYAEPVASPYTDSDPVPSPYAEPDSVPSPYADADSATSPHAESEPSPYPDPVPSPYPDPVPSPYAGPAPVSSSRPYWEVGPETEEASSASSPAPAPPEPLTEHDDRPGAPGTRGPAFGISDEEAEAEREARGEPPADPATEALASPADEGRASGRSLGGGGSDQATVHVPAVHLGGIANLAPGEAGLELRFADPGLDIAREDDAVLGRISWEEIRSVEVAAPGRLRRRRKDPEAKLVIRTERGDASFRIPGTDEDELRIQLAPALVRVSPHA